MTLIDPDIRRLDLLMSDLSGQVGNLQDWRGVASRNIQSLIDGQTSLPAYPVSNLLWNGELGHSVFTWNEVTGPPTGDKNEECAWFYAHMKPFLPIAFTSGNVDATANTITLTAHGIVTGTLVDLTTAGTLAAPLVIATSYWAIVVDANTIKLATTLANALAGTAIDLTTTGTGSSHIQQKLDATTAAVSATNNELKNSAHSTYNSRFSRWNAPNGWAELNGTSSVDALMPSNLIDASTPLARVGVIAAKRHRYIDIPSDALLAAGIWDNTSGQRCFLQSSVTFNATLAGAAGTVERRYRIDLTSDRGYSILSDEVTIANAPSDAQFSSSRNIEMSWEPQPGQLQVDIYEYLPAGGDGLSAPEYRLIAEVSSGTSHIHEGGELRTVSGYPTPTGTKLEATFFTKTGELTQLATNGIGFWDTVTFPDHVPQDYDKSNTTDRQWVRIWASKECDLLIDGITTDGTTTVTAPAAAGTIPTAFESEYASLIAGLVAKVYDSNGTLIATTTVSSRTDDTHLVLGSAIAAGSNRSLRIVAGGFHGIIIDKVHLGYQLNTSYAPNSQDSRTLQPRAAPSSSTQGGVGTGGGDGGGDGGGVDKCIAGDTPLKLRDGEWKQVAFTQGGDIYASGGVGGNRLIRLKPGVDNVRRVTSANGVSIVCTDTECFVTSRDDATRGTPLFKLRVGDTVLTEIDDRIEETTVAEISEHLGRTVVYSPMLEGGHLFIAGEVAIKGMSFREKILSLFSAGHGRTADRRGGFVLHNRKPGGDGFIVF